MDWGREPYPLSCDAELASSWFVTVFWQRTVTGEFTVPTEEGGDVDSVP